MSKDLTIKDFHLYKKIGEGMFGEVFLTRKDNYPEILATKIMDIKKVNDKRILNYLNNEILIMKELNHPNIIRLHKFLHSSNHYFVIMEYCNGGMLSNLLTNYKLKFARPFPIEVIQYFMRQIVEGLKYIHSHNIIHRDIKLDNILLKVKNKNKLEIEDIEDSLLLTSEIKIIDFGLATRLDPDRLANTAAGSPINMAPCILKKYNKAGGYDKLQGYNEKADIWSLGTICYEMLTGEPLFNANDFNELIEKVEKGNYSLPININLSNELISFLNSMLQYNGESRASAEELSRHDFLTKNVDQFTKANLEKIPEKIDLGYLIINTIKNSTIKGMFDKKEENQKRVMKQYIDCLYNDYNAAQKYFQENKLTKQEQDAIMKCNDILKVKQHLEKGNIIYISTLPKPITPEYIYGCSKVERNNIFIVILTTKRADLKNLEIKLKSYKNKPLTQSVQKEIEKNKLKYNELKQIIKDIENLSKNEWVPPPEYKKELQKYNSERINYDKCEFQMKVQVKRIENKIGNLNLKLYLLVNESKTIKKEVQLKAENNFSEEYVWNLTAKEWKNIDNNNDNFILGIRNNDNINPNNSKKVVTIDVSNVKNGKAITFKQSIPSDNKEKINISIFPISPEGEKLNSVEVKEFIVIKNLYPPFECKSSMAQKFIK